MREVTGSTPGLDAVKVRKRVPEHARKNLRGVVDRAHKKNVF
jgi:hypothetical protein